MNVSTNWMDLCKYFDVTSYVCVFLYVNVWHMNIFRPDIIYLGPRKEELGGYVYTAIITYCSWKKSCAWQVVLNILSRVLYIPGGWEWDFWTINQ